MHRISWGAKKIVGAFLKQCNTYMGVLQGFGSRLPLHSKWNSV